MCEGWKKTCRLILSESVVLASYQGLGDARPKADGLRHAALTQHQVVIQTNAITSASSGAGEVGEKISRPPFVLIAGHLEGALQSCYSVPVVYMS